MKILLISPTSGGIGGIAQHVDGLSQFLTGLGHEVDIISSANTFTIPIKRLKNPSFMFSSFLKTKFKKGKDIVHAHHIAGALAMKNVSGKKILSIHGIYSKNIAQLYGKTTSNISKKYEKTALNWADAITVNSKEGYNHYTEMGFNVVQIPNAIDLNLIPKKSTKQFKIAKKYMPGGVNSPVRSFNAVHSDPFFIKKAKGALICDIDNKKYIDYVGSWGAMILGHCDSRVVRTLSKSINTGITFGAPCQDEVLLAKKVCKIFPSIEKIRMVNSGTEATMSAARLARAYTKRDMIAYCGTGGVWHDWQAAMVSRDGGVPKFNEELINWDYKGFWLGFGE